MYYESLSCQSTGNAARKIPVRPPNVKSPMKPSEKSIGESNWRFPRHVVASQLKILMPVGTAMTIDEIMKKLSSPTPSPVVNMWCAHTSIEKNAIASVEKATAL